MVTRVPANEEVLLTARKSVSLSLEEAAKRLGAKPQYLQRIETGDIKPSATIFRKMARVYCVPEATLLANSFPVLPKLPTDHRTFEGLTPGLTYETIIAIRKVSERQEILEELAEIDPLIKRAELPKFTRDENPFELGEAERKRIGISRSEQLSLTPDKLFMKCRVLLEEMGISVYVEKFPIEDCKGISLQNHGFPAIILNQNEKRDAWKLFTLLHEYAHLLIREPGISDQSRKSGIESFCNKFAASFLLPATLVKNALYIESGKKYDFTLPELDKFASRLSVSISVLALRLEEMGIVRGGFYNSIKGLLISPPKPPKKGIKIPRKYLILSNLGHNFTGVILDSMNRGTISRLDASRLLHASPIHFLPIQSTINKRRGAAANAT